MTAHKQYWEMVADDIKRMGFSYGYSRICIAGVGAVWQADAQRDDGHRYVARAETLLTAFVHLKQHLQILDTAT